MTSGADRHDRDAVAALVRRLGNRGEGEGQFALDDELFAREFIASLKGYGWRPVLVPSAASDWRRAKAAGTGAPLDPAVKAALFEELAGASQAIRSGTRNTGGLPVLPGSSRPEAGTAPQ